MAIFFYISAFWGKFAYNHKMDCRVKRGQKNTSHHTELAPGSLIVRYSKDRGLHYLLTPGSQLHADLIKAIKEINNPD